MDPFRRNWDQYFQCCRFRQPDVLEWFLREYLQDLLAGGDDKWVFCEPLVFLVIVGYFLLGAGESILEHLDQDFLDFLQLCVFPLLFSEQLRDQSFLKTHF